MTSMTQEYQGLTAAGCAAPASWPATSDGITGARNCDHLAVAHLIPATSVVKPSFQATTRRPTEGSS